jgi:hypothetical protein
VILNLLSNAVKFTPDGEKILVVANLVDGEVQVSVRDTGNGIPRKEWDRIFEPFQQGAHGPGTPREGTGLGLTLSREFVELHGGQLWLESDVGRGSTFLFTLPTGPTLLERATPVGNNSVSE